MQQLSSKICWQQVQDNRLASSNYLHSMEVDWYEKKLYFRRFHIPKCKGLRMSFITWCTTIALQIMLESFLATQEWLHTLSLRFYFTYNFEEQNIPFTFHLYKLGMLKRDLHSLKILSLLQIKPPMSASEWQYCSDCQSQLLSPRQHFLCMVSSWVCCWGCSCSQCSAIIDSSVAAQSVLFVGSVWPVYGVAAVWVSFKFVFVFQDLCIGCQSASSVCVSPCQQWPSHLAV